MGSLPTHFSAFIFLFPIGFRRLVSTVPSYFKSPSQYRSRAWYHSDSKWKNLDLCGLLIILPVAAFAEIFWFLTFSGNSSYRFAFFQQSAVLFLFWLVVLAIALREYVDVFLVHESMIFLFAAVAFLVEYSVTGQGFSGIGACLYDLLSACTLVCSFSCFLLSIKPTAFFADVALSSGIILKATWVLQTGLSLFSDAFSPKGCKKITARLASEKGDVECVLEEDRLRGLALIEFLFVIHALGVFTLILVTLGFLSSNRKLGCGDGTSSMTLSDIGSECALMRSAPELELD